MARTAALTTSLLLGALLAFAPLAQADSTINFQDNQQTFQGFFSLTGPQVGPNPDVASLVWPTNVPDPDIYIGIVNGPNAFFHTLTVNVSRIGSTGPITGAAFFFDFLFQLANGLLRFNIYSCATPNTVDGVCSPGDFVFITTADL